MGRTRATARRGGSKNLGRSIPSNGYGARIDTLPKVSDSLVEFVFQGRTTCEPPRKRQKRMMDGNTADSTDSSSILGSENKETGLDYIIVRESKWDIKCDGSRLSNVEMPLQRSNIKTFIAWPRLMTEKSRPQYIEVVDGSRTVFFAQFPEEEQSLGDVVLALRVDQESKKWAKGQGRLWTEVGLELQSKDGIDYVQMVFTIKWNTTNSPVHIARFKSKIPSLKSVLDAYFPDPNTTKLDAWTPQDFYQSVHAPNQADDVAATLRTVELESTLYPFQKRAVSWLLRREGVEWSGTDVRAPQLQDNHPEQVIGSFIKAKDARGRHCYISHLFGLVTLDLHTFKTQERSLSGGILAEEMGLGKTLEIISLITLHKRTQQPATVFDAYIGEEVRPTAATLIISPPSLIQQWISEVNRHAPHLKVTHYEGIKAHRKMGPAELLDSLAGSDVVISTYSVLAAEIHYTALNPEKSLRRESKYPRPKSPLMKLSWWRICMDEAQMIESGVSNAAVVARLIPRINAWCVTGTPVRRDVNDLLGLLIFLRYEPYASTKHVWSSLISSHKPEFRRLFSTLALRHSKRSVREELKLPAQRRYVITMPFTPIEEQHYQELFSQMCEESGLDNEGAPLTDDWDPNLVAEHMRRWLVRLRQTALHPEVGGRNRRALGHNDGPLRTVDQVLDVMMEQTDVAIRTDQRMILASKLKRGQLYENSPKVKTALEIWDEAAKEASEVVEECREQLRLEIAKSPAEASSGREGSLDSGDDNSAFDNQEE
jgi:E3 ubiquitin-protein ligase SHPRH